MNKTTNIVVGIVAVIALVIGTVAYNKVPTRVAGSAGAQGERGLKGEKGDRGEQGIPGRDGRNATTPTFGAASSDFFAPQTSLNGVATIAQASPFRTSTTTPCAFLVTATSSLSFFSLQIASTSAQSTIYAIGTSTTPYATTSVIATFPTVAAASQASQSWYGGQTQVGNISPGTYLVMSVAGVTGGSPGGTCKYEAKVY